jgi:hypothetical protein
LLTAVYTIHEDREERRVSNLFELTKSHREIWSLLIERPELARILDRHANVQEQPITETEKRFVLFLILHLAASFEAQKQGMFVEADGLRRDVHQFFSRPIPRAVWMEFRSFQNSDFAAFVDDVIGDPARKGS